MNRERVPGSKFQVPGSPETQFPRSAYSHNPEPRKPETWHIQFSEAMSGTWNLELGTWNID